LRNTNGKKTKSGGCWGERRETEENGAGLVRKIEKKGNGKDLKRSNWLGGVRVHHGREE